ncbi:MAG: HAD hydrolase-like protein, partial [Clostridia bacterium]|nr:HAD hydrolase-like protein [Clostridia bacterium]
IFDFDGTLAETGDGVITSARYALNALGKPLPGDDEMRLFLGPPLDYSYREICHLDEDDIPKAIKLYREFYSEKGLYMLRLYDGITELLTELSNAGVVLATASSKPEVYLKEAVKTVGIDKYLSFICGKALDDTDASKEKVILKALTALGADKQTTLMVGDRCFDIESAKRVGIKSAGVLFGYGTKEELLSCGADYIAETARDIFRIVDKA